MQHVFRYYSDAGHGWLAVKRKLLSDLGLLDKITPFSYQKGDTVYLEEDQDMSVFIDAYKKKFGMQPKCADNYSKHSPIRYYECFRNN